MTPPREDSELIAATVGGDLGAFSELVGRYQEVAFRAAYLITRDAGAAEEAAQDGFVRAHKALAGFRQSEPFRPWLLRIVTNLALNQVRSRSRRAGLLERLGVERQRSVEVPADEMVLRTHNQRQLWSAIRELPPDDRVVLYLRYFLELPEQEIAQVIGKAPGTVKSRLSRASGRLRTVIEQRYPSLLPSKGGGGD